MTLAAPEPPILFLADKGSRLCPSAAYKLAMATAHHTRSQSHQPFARIAARRTADVSESRRGLRGIPALRGFG